jgi:hypothetical protein
MKALSIVGAALLVGAATVRAEDPEYVMRVGDRLITQAELDAWYTSTRKRVCVHAGEAVLGRQMYQLWITGKITHVFADDGVVIVDRGYDAVAVRLESIEEFREGAHAEVWCMPQSEMYRYVTATGDVTQARRYLNISATLDPDGFMANCEQRFILDLLPPPQHATPLSASAVRSRAANERHVTLLRPVKPRNPRPPGPRAA